MYGISDYPNGTAGTRERPEMCAPITAAGKWDVATSIPATLIDMDATQKLSSIFITFLSILNKC